MKPLRNVFALSCLIGVLAGQGAWANDEKQALVSDLIAERGCKYAQANAGEIAQASGMDAGEISMLVIEMLKTGTLVPSGTNEMTLSGWGACPKL